MFFLAPVPFSVVSATHFLVNWFLTWPWSLDPGNMWYFAPSNLVLGFLIFSTIQLCFIFTLHTNFLSLIYFSHHALHFCIHPHLLIFSYVAYALPSKWRAEQYLVFMHFLFGGHCPALCLLFPANKLCYPSPVQNWIKKQFHPQFSTCLVDFLSFFLPTCKYYVFHFITVRS